MRIPLYLSSSIITSSVALLFALDTGSISSITTMESFKATFGDFSPVLHGVIVSSILLTGAISALFAGVVAQQLGYAKVIALGSLVYSIGAAIECGSSVLGIFIFGRLLKGLGTGLFISNIYVQISETSPFKVRGILTALPQFTIVFGLAMGYFICYGTARLAPSSASWRVPFALASGLGLLASMTYFIMPTSPRWLLARGKIDEARTTVEKLGWDEEEIRQFLSEPSTSEEAEVAELSFKESIKQMFHGFRETFSAPFRARTIFGCFTMASQQFSGIDGVLYYAPILFTQAGLKSNEANFLASGISAIVILVTTLPATLLADSWGRKTSCVTGGVAMTGLMLLMGSLYASNQVHATYGAGKWVVIVSIYLFAVVFSGTWAVAIRTSLVESAPRKTRSSASSLAQSANWLSNYTVALITPVLISKSSYGAYYLFAGCTLISTVAMAMYMVETRGISLEAIEERYSEKKALSTGVVENAIRLRVVTSTHG